jgi:hypothetical protein
MTLFGKTIVTLLLLIIGGTGYYFYQGSESRKAVVLDPNGPGQLAYATTTTPASKKIAFSQLMSQNGTYKCTVNQYVGDIESKGTVYMDKGLLRGEFATAVANQKIDTTMILRDGYTYTWTSMAPTMGFKSKVAEPTTTSTTTATSGTYSWNADQIGDYNCEAWTGDESKFALPATIKFTEVK